MVADSSHITFIQRALGHQEASYICYRYSKEGSRAFPEGVLRPAWELRRGDTLRVSQENCRCEGGFCGHWDSVGLTRRKRTENKVRAGIQEKLGLAQHPGSRGRNMK